MTSCVYALTTARLTRLEGRGLNGERLRLVTVASLSAIVGDLRAVPKPTPGNLRRYAAVMQRLFEASHGLLPARFGTCVGDGGELEFILRSRQAALRSALRHVRGRAQMTLRVAVAGESVPPPPPRRAPRSGADYLRSRAAAAARLRDIPGFDPVRAATARWVRDERVDRHAALATVYHLVPRGAVESYRAVVTRAADAAGTRLTISGPWPPFAFAEG